MIHFHISIRSALLSSILFLTGLGLISVYASSSIFALETFGDSLFFVRKQALVAGLGVLAIFAIGHLRLAVLKRAAVPLYLLSLLLLMLIFVPGMGHFTKGASRWISLGGISFQPSEFAKLAFVFVFAKNLARPSFDIRSPYSLLSCAVLVLIPSALIMAQPDFGTAFLFCLVALVMLFKAGLSWRYLLSLLVIGLGALGLLILWAPYRLQRLLIYLDPWKEYEGGGFQIIQSLLAFKAGGIWGVGLGESKQKLFFLPDAHTDFILAVISEEFGLLGTLAMIIIFAYLFFLGWLIVSNLRDRFRSYLACGLVLFMSLQALLNMAVTMGLLPTKGIGLPLVSNGSSSLLCFLLSAAILARLTQSDAVQQCEDS